MSKNNSSNVWITVAFRTGMRLYNYDSGDRYTVNLVQTLEHPEGHLKDSELGSDQPGRSFDSKGGARHSLSKEHSPSQHITETFAKTIATILDEGRVKNKFSKLILIAGPAFLGTLRHSLNTQTNAMVVHSINKDLVNLSEHEMKEHLEKIVKEFFLA